MESIKDGLLLTSHDLKVRYTTTPILVLLQTGITIRLNITSKKYSDDEHAMLRRTAK